METLTLCFDKVPDFGPTDYLSAENTNPSQEKEYIQLLLTYLTA